LGASVQQLLGGNVQVRTELSEGSHFSVLSQLQFESTGHLFHGFDLCGRTDTGHGETHINGGTDTFIEQFGFQENLAISDGNHVGRDIGGHVTGLGFNDGQSGQGSSSEVLVHFGGSFEQSGVEIKDVTGVSLSSWRSSKQQGHLSVGNSLFRKIVVYNEGMFAVVTEVLADGAGGVRCQELQRGGFRGSGGHDDGIFHSVVFFQDIHNVDNGGAFLTNSNIDAVKLFLKVT